MRMGITWLLLVALVMIFSTVAVFALMVVAGRRQGHRSREKSVRISAEIERVDAMLASGRITADEAEELRDALKEQHPGTGTPFADRRLVKTQTPILAGVCGGIADWLGWDPTLVRVLFALATLMIAGFPGVLLYIVLALVMPPHSEADNSAGKGIGAVLAVACLALALLLAFLLFAYILLGFRVRMHSQCAPEPSCTTLAVPAPSSPALSLVVASERPTQ